MSDEPKTNPPHTVNPLTQLIVRKMVHTILDAITEAGGGNIQAGAKVVSLDLKEADKINSQMLDLLSDVSDMGPDVGLIADFIDDLNDAVEEWREKIQQGVCKGTLDELAFLYGECRAENEAERIEQVNADEVPLPEDEDEGSEGN